jgi:hypothetical protein
MDNMPVALPVLPGKSVWHGQHVGSPAQFLPGADNGGKAASSESGEDVQWWRHRFLYFEVEGQGQPWGPIPLDKPDSFGQLVNVSSPLVATQFLQHK